MWDGAACAAAKAFGDTAFVEIGEGVGRRRAAQECEKIVGPVDVEAEAGKLDDGGVDTKSASGLEMRKEAIVAETEG